MNKSWREAYTNSAVLFVIKNNFFPAADNLRSKSTISAGLNRYSPTVNAALQFIITTANSTVNTVEVIDF